MLPHWAYPHVSYDCSVSEWPIFHLVMHGSLMAAPERAKNIQTVIVARFLAGGFGSTGAVMVGGTIADIWKPHELAISLSSLSYNICAYAVLDGGYRCRSTLSLLSVGLASDLWPLVGWK